ncbi:MAG: hypothetical protein ACQ5SW_06085 [Sphaerochaetaceae bacterium]
MGQKKGGWNLWRNHKRLIVCICILLLGIPAWSLSLDSLSAGKRNDWYTMGLGHNHDDGLSFGSTVEAVFSSSFTLTLQTSGYTDRLDSLSRYDVSTLSASYSFSIPKEQQILVFTPRGGMMVTGNLGFSKAQNFFHSLIGRDPLQLTYSTDEISFHPYIGAKATLGNRIGKTALALELDMDYTKTWEQTFSSNLLLQFGSFLSFRLGYLLRTTSDTCSVHDVMVSRYQGPTLSYQYDGGLLQTQFITYLETGRSFGGFSFDILSLGKKKQFRSADFIFSTGFLYDLNGQQNRLFSFTYRNASFEVRHKNGPMFNHMEAQDNRLNIGSWMVGYAWNLPLSSTWEPYGKLLAGIQRFNLQKNFTTTVIEAIRPTIAVEVGVKGLGIPGWIIERQNYRMRIVSTLQYVFGTEKISEVDPYFSEHTGPWILQTGIVIDIGHDQAEEQRD